jgi:peptide chain release factor 3
MIATHSRTGKKVRLSSSHKLFGNERETVNEAFPGDIIGIVGHDEFGIGDTLTTDSGIAYREIPRFPPEAFAFLRNPSTAKFKQFRKGLDQLLQEGVIQLLRLKDNLTANQVLLAAVGPLQFEVVQYRLQSEYGAESRLEPAPFAAIRWLPAGMDGSLSLPTGVKLAFDTDNHPVVLFGNDWAVGYFQEINPNVRLDRLPPMPA